MINLLLENKAQKRRVLGAEILENQCVMGNVVDFGKFEINYCIARVRFGIII